MQEAVMSAFFASLRSRNCIYTVMAPGLTLASERRYKVKLELKSSSSRYVHDVAQNAG
jgi:hypothetical protein